MRWAAPVVYAILLLIGWWMIADRQRPAPEPLAAAHDLPPNHRLAPGDFIAAAPAPVHHPRAQERRARQAKRHCWLSSAEILSQNRAGRVYRSAGLVNSGDIDAGKQVQICKGQEVKIKSTPVRATICDPTDTVCWIVVAITADQSAGLNDLFAKAPLPTVTPVRANSNC